MQAALDPVAAQVQDGGGQVLFRFKTLASGFAAEMTGANASGLLSRKDVSSVHVLHDYSVALSETVPWIGAADLQQLGIDGTGVKVAVIDSGIDYTHAAFGGPGTVAAWHDAYFGSDPACTDGTQAVCAKRQPPDPSLFGPSAPKVKGGWDFVGPAWPDGPLMPGPNPIDMAEPDSGHGTHVADIIAGLAFDDVGPGVAPGADLYAFGVCSAVSTSCSGSALLAAVDAAADLDGNPANYDPADVMNLSLGSDYGQPEDDLTYFVNQAVAYGSIVVTSAGNGGYKPYVLGSPSAANGAISVAETTVPSEKAYAITAAGLGAPPVLGILQPWSTPFTTTVVSGTLVYDTTNAGTMQGCSDANGTNPWAAGAFTGAVLLMDRGSCAISMKVSNAFAAGAVLAIIANNRVAPQYDLPPGFSFGGGTPNIPGLTVTQSDGARLKMVAGQTASVDPTQFVGLADNIVSSSSRGPRINDSALKPDIGAPGASVSADSGSGDGSSAFGGTSGASPMVAGAAALLKGQFGDELLPQQYKALLMNTANTEIYLDGNPATNGGGRLAAVSRIGAGRVDVLKASRTKLLAWDSTDESDPLAWTGSLSFGYQPVSDTYVATRTLTIWNRHPLDQEVLLSSDFRYAEEVDMGVTVEPLVTDISIAAGSMVTIPVRLTIDAAALPAWTTDKGEHGYDGYLFDTLEFGGYLTIEAVTGGTPLDEAISVPWYVVPKKVADTSAALAEGEQVSLMNASPKVTSTVEGFALLDQSANLYDYTVHYCAGADCNQTLPDIKEVGVRTRDDAGTPVIELAVTLWDKPYRAAEFPVEIDVYVDVDRDGTDDYDIFNYDYGAYTVGALDGRNTVFVYDLHTDTLAAVYFTDSDFNTQNYILTVPLLGVTAGQSIDFQVWVADVYFYQYLPTDCSPMTTLGVCGYHTYTVGEPRYDLGADTTFQVPPEDTLDLPYTVAASSAASPSQKGLLFLYRGAHVGEESTAVPIWYTTSYFPLILQDDQP